MNKQNLLKVLKSVGITLGILTLVFVGQSFENYWINKSLDHSVVYVTSENNLRSGGTGFHVKAPSGKTYLLTNSHVCNGVSHGTDKVWVRENENDRPLPRRIIEVFKEHDLCLVEAVTGMKAINVSSNSPDVGDNIFMYGHPALRPLTFEAGNYIGSTNILIEISPGLDGSCPGTQSLIGNSSYDLLDVGQYAPDISFVWYIPCLVKYKTYSAKILSYPGNSGSPVVNSAGNLIGVLFAGSRMQNTDSHLVPLEYIHKLLKFY